MSGEDPTVVEPTEDPTQEPEEWTPPTKEEWEKVTGTLAKRKEEAAAARREAAAAKEAAKSQDASEAAKQVAAAQEASDNRARRSAGITALVEAGMSRAQAKDALGLLKLTDLEVDEDGDVDGVDDAVEELKKKFPGMFPDSKAKPPRQRTADGGGRDGGTKTPTERTNERLLRSAGLL